MIQNIVLPSISIIVGLIYLKWLYRRKKGFLGNGDDLFLKSQTLKGWLGGLILIVVGILFLVKGISNYL